MAYRSFLPGTTVHVIQRGNNKGRIFYAAHDSALFLEWLTNAAAVYGLAVHAYVLMTNHIHLLATVGTRDSLARTMQSVGIRYTRYVNATQNRTGTLWEGRYKSCVIDRDDYLLACARYIEMNPVRAGMATTPDVYRWSSYRANALGREDALVTPHPLYDNMGATPTARQEAYQALFDQPSATFDDTLRTATQRGVAVSAVGTERPRGRPRKTPL